MKIYGPKLKREKMNILLLGNGFDLYHSLPTKYINFLSVVSFLANNTAVKVDTVGDVFGNVKLQQLDNGIARSYERYKNAYDRTKLEPSVIQKLVSLGKTNMWFSYLFHSDVPSLQAIQSLPALLQKCPKQLELFP